MLVLTRKVHQRIQIGDQITITIVRIKGQTVRVGIDAPSEIRVLRSELSAACPSSGSQTARGGEELSAQADVKDKDAAPGDGPSAAERLAVPRYAAGGRQRQVALNRMTSLPTGAGLPA